TQVRYWAAAKEAAGVPADQVSASFLDAALTQVRARHSDRFSTVLQRCSFVVDGDPVGGRDHATIVLADDSLVDVLPPFAGG
ncbi:MAG: MoaD/ThiS family protein, partial [Mycobacteriales bacterium]